MCTHKIAITGGIACGKSEVGRLLAERGVCVLDTDTVVSGLIDSDTDTSREIVKRFGSDVSAPDGGIARAGLAKIVFYDQARLEELNRIIHPVVEAEWMKWLDSQSADSAAAVQIPLLYEIDKHEGWDAVICCWTAVGVQMERIEKRGMNREDAAARIEAQMPVARKAELADFVIVNNGTLDNLKKQVDKVLDSVLEK